jgi:hypothetical protein
MPTKPFTTPLTDRERWTAGAVVVLCSFTVAFHQKYANRNCESEDCRILSAGILTEYERRYCRVNPMLSGS